MTQRVAIIGDIGAHLLMFQEQLIVLGVDLDASSIPDDLVICQVGDLIHKGHDSAAVVEMVDRLIKHNPGQWVQLLGNHESQYLDGGTQFWTPSLDSETEQTLRRWWDNGDMKIAANFWLADQDSESDAIDASPGGELLVTHAGLTAGAWQLLGSTHTVSEIVDALNRAQAAVIWREGAIITGTEDQSAGPLWAVATSEVYQSWSLLEDRTPSLPVPVMTQAHGHTSAMSWRRDRWREPMEQLITKRSVTAIADPKRKITRVEIGARTFFGTDPESGRAPQTVSIPLVLPIT